MVHSSNMGFQIPAIVICCQEIIDLFNRVKIQSDNPGPAVTSYLDSFQSSFRSISWKDSCDLGPFLISSTSMIKVSVLSGGILPDHGGESQKEMSEGSDDVVRAAARPQNTTHRTKKVLKGLERRLWHQHGKYRRHVNAIL